MHIWELNRSVKRSRTPEERAKSLEERSRWFVAIERQPWWCVVRAHLFHRLICKHVPSGGSLVCRTHLACHRLHQSRKVHLVNLPIDLDTAKGLRR